MTGWRGAALNAALLAGAVLLAGGMTAAGLPALRRLHLSGITDPDAYDLWFAGLCLAPAAIVHGAGRLNRVAGPSWWAAWLPGIAVYVLRPWKADGPWRPLWVFDDAWSWGREIVLHYETASAFTVNAALGLGAVSAAAVLAAGRLWMAAAKAVGRLGAEAVAPGGAGASGSRPGLASAAWASRREVAKQFGHEGGIVLGQHTDPLRETPGFEPGRKRTWRRQAKGPLITMNPAEGNGHVLVLAASAGYKTSGIVIPNILNYAGPVVVFDPKGDLHARTREARAEMGFRSVVIDAENGFDPFKMVAPIAAKSPSVHISMARTLMPASSRPSDISEYFHEMSTNLFAGLMAHFLERNPDSVAGSISRFINRPRGEVIQQAEGLAREAELAFVAEELAGLAAIDERTWPGVMKGISNKLAFTRFPDIAAYGESRASPIEHLAALEPDTDVFISLPAQAAKDFASFPRLLLGGMLVVAEQVEQPDRPRARRLFLIDEARVLGGMDVLASVRDAGRSVGMHLMLIYQSLGQVIQAWGGDAGAEGWIDSCEARVVSAAASRRTATDISEMLGRSTIRVTTGGSSQSSQIMSVASGSVSSSEQEQLREVPLLGAAAIGQLPAHGSVIFTRRTPPILASKAIYFTRPDMAGRVRTPEEVADELTVNRRRESILASIGEAPGEAAEGEGGPLFPPPPDAPEESGEDEANRDGARDGAGRGDGARDGATGDDRNGSAVDGRDSAPPGSGDGVADRDRNGTGASAGDGATGDDQTGSAVDGHDGASPGGGDGVTDRDRNGTGASAGEGATGDDRIGSAVDGHDGASPGGGDGVADRDQNGTGVGAGGGAPVGAEGGGDGRIRDGAVDRGLCASAADQDGANPGSETSDGDDDPGRGTGSDHDGASGDDRNGGAGNGGDNASVGMEAWLSPSKTDAGGANDSIDPDATRKRDGTGNASEQGEQASSRDLLRNGEAGAEDARNSDTEDRAVEGSLESLSGDASGAGRGGPAANAPELDAAGASAGHTALDRRAVAEDGDPPDVSGRPDRDIRNAGIGNAPELPVGESGDVRQSGLASERPDSGAMERPASNGNPTWKPVGGQPPEAAGASKPATGDGHAKVAAPPPTRDAREPRSANPAGGKPEPATATGGGTPRDADRQSGETGEPAPDKAAPGPGGAEAAHRAKIRVEPPASHGGEGTDGAEPEVGRAVRDAIRDAGRLANGASPPSRDGEDAWSHDEDMLLIVSVLEELDTANISEVLGHERESILRRRVVLGTHIRRLANNEGGAANAS